MTCYKISMLYQVTSNDRLVSKTQMGTGYTTGFLCVIFKICLYILICMVTNDLNGILICTNSTIGSKTPELTAYSAWCCYLDLISYWKRSKGKVIIDTYCKVVLRLFLIQLVKYSNDLCRSSILNGKSITSANDLWMHICFIDHAAYIQI